MKKLLIICASAVLLSACADKQDYEQAVLTQMQGEKDIQDYNIDAQDMTDCIVDVTSKKMPGLFQLDPDRLMAYRNYTKMLSMSTAKDKKKTFEELKATFKSPKDLKEAHSNYTESFMTCVNVFIQREEEDMDLSS